MSLPNKDSMPGVRMNELRVLLQGRAEGSKMCGNEFEVWIEDIEDETPVVRRPQRRAPIVLNNPSAAAPSPFGGRQAAAVEDAPFGTSRSQQPARVGGDDATPKTVRREEPKVGRNDPCPCGSGKKYKKCHGAAA